jgi:acetyl-CoA acetyltransferase
MDTVILTSVALTPSRARREKGEQVLTAEQYQAKALCALLEKIGWEKKDLCKTKYALGLNEPLWPHALIYSSEVVANLGLSPKTTFVSDHGGMSALNLLLQAHALLTSELVDYVILLGADSPMTPSTPQGKWRLERTWRYELNYELPLGMIGPLSEVALIAQRHIHLYGTKEEQMGKVAVSFRTNALENPNAYLKQPLTLDEYLKSPYIAQPLRMFDAVIPVNCGYALILTREDFAKRFGDTFVKIKAVSARVNFEAQNELREITNLGLKQLVSEALEKANTTLDQVDVFQLYDDFTIITIMQLEELGVCEKGKGGEFVEKNDLTYKGNFPTNTGGGQLSAGQAGTAGGFLLLTEAVSQLLGEAGGRQVKGAEKALVTGLGGLGYNHNLLNQGVAILSR